MKKKLLALTLLISFLGTNSVSAALFNKKTPVLNAGTEQNVKKYDKYNGKYNFKTEKIKPQKNKYEYVNMEWWKQFNDEYLNDYIIRAVENNKDLKMASLVIDEYYQNVRMQRSNELPAIATKQQV